MTLLLEWLSGNYIELLGAILGIAYVFFSIRQSILTWPVGLLTSLLYVWVFLVSKLYADMGLQLYYVVISIYGWYEWLKADPTDHKPALTISRLQVKTGLVLGVLSLVLFGIIWYILKEYTDSTVPVSDALATALSIVATWMLARKILEHWLVWIFVDAFSIGLFLYKGLYPTVILFVVYTVMACIGFKQWRKEIKPKKIRIVITGPESSGKTILARQLAELFKGQYIPEHAREYVEALNRPYTRDDVEAIARTQISQYQATGAGSGELYFFDTWLIITKVWFNWVFGQTPAWLEEQIQACPVDLFLLCRPDLPWEADPVRENGGENRIRLFDEYRKELIRYGFTFVEIGGTGEDRLKNAIFAVRNFCKLP